MRLIIYVECPPPFQQFCLTPQSASSRRANRQLWLPGRRGPAPILPLRQSHGCGPRRPRLIVDTYREFLIYLQRQARQRGAPTLVPVSRKENGAADTGSARSANGSAAETPRNRRKSFVPQDLPLPAFDFASVRRSATLPNEVFQKAGSAKEQKRPQCCNRRGWRGPAAFARCAFARARRRIELPKNFSSLSGPGQFRGPEKHS